MVPCASAITFTKRRPQQMDTLKLLAGILSGVVYAVPESIRMAVLAACILTLVDTVTGFWIAARKGEATSFKMRHKLATKLFEFMTIGALGAVGWMLSQSFVPLGISFAIIIGIEAASNLENLSWLEANGGAPLGPFRPALKRLGSYFAAETLMPEKEAQHEPIRRDEDSRRD